MEAQEIGGRALRLVKSLMLVAAVLGIFSDLGARTAQAQGTWGTVTGDKSVIIGGGASPLQTLNVTLTCTQSYPDCIAKMTGGTACIDPVAPLCGGGIISEGTVAVWHPEPIASNFGVQVTRVFGAWTLVGIFLQEFFPLGLVYSNPISLTVTPTRLESWTDQPELTATFQHPQMADWDLCQFYSYGATDGGPYIPGPMGVCGTVPAGSLSVTFTGAALPRAPSPGESLHVLVGRASAPSDYSNGVRLSLRPVPTISTNPSCDASLGPCSANIVRGDAADQTTLYVELDPPEAISVDLSADFGSVPPSVQTDASGEATATYTAGVAPTDATTTIGKIWRDSTTLTWPRSIISGASLSSTSTRPRYRTRGSPCTQSGTSAKFRRSLSPKTHSFKSST